MGDLGRAVNRLIRDLREGQEEHTSRFLDAAPDAVVMADTHGVIVDWNAAAHTMFGWPREEAIGMTLADTIVPEDQ
ncbi:MAG: PAS domain-containing protein, partial [Gemmatimonadetes bacterium]|nr:PAS domain-containing protein [Gemmatimonadota bacterium]